MDGYIYQSFWFTNKIKKKFYTGNGFSQYQEDMGILDSLDLGLSMFNEEDSFMPGLIKQIDELIGEGNFIFDFWEFGPDGFSLYWYIKKEVYQNKMKLIDKWVEYEEIHSMIDFQISDC